VYNTPKSCVGVPSYVLLSFKKFFFFTYLSTKRHVRYVNFVNFTLYNYTGWNLNIYLLKNRLEYYHVFDFHMRLFYTVTWLWCHSCQFLTTSQSKLLYCINIIHTFTRTPCSIIYILTNKHTQNDKIWYLISKKQLYCRHVLYRCQSPRCQSDIRWYSILEGGGFLLYSMLNSSTKLARNVMTYSSNSCLFQQYHLETLGCPVGCEQMN